MIVSNQVRVRVQAQAQDPDQRHSYPLCTPFPIYLTLNPSQARVRRVLSPVVPHSLQLITVVRQMTRPFPAKVICTQAIRV